MLELRQLPATQQQQGTDVLETSSTVLADGLVQISLTGDSVDNPVVHLLHLCTNLWPSHQTPGQYLPTDTQLC